MAEPTRDEVDRWPGATVLEFGATWCPICQRARPMIDRVLGRAVGAHPGLRHLWVEDAAGRRLGRSFRIKLWPTLVVLQGGVEVARVVRPRDEDEVEAALAALAIEDRRDP